MDSGRTYSAAEMERMMKIQDVLLKAMAKKDQLGDSRGNRRGDSPNDACSLASRERLNGGR